MNKLSHRVGERVNLILFPAIIINKSEREGFDWVVRADAPIEGENYPRYEQHLGRHVHIHESDIVESSSMKDWFTKLIDLHNSYVNLYNGEKPNIMIIDEASYYEYVDQISKGKVLPFSGKIIKVPRCGKSEISFHYEISQEEKGLTLEIAKSDMRVMIEAFRKIVNLCEAYDTFFNGEKTLGKINEIEKKYS